MTAQLARSMALVFAASLLGSFGAAFLKRGACCIKNWRTVLNPALAFGVILFVTSSFFYIAGIRGGELSVLYPMVSLGYIWTLLWSRLFFKERFTRNKLLGIALILVGVVFVGIGSGSDPAPPCAPPQTAAAAGVSLAR